MAEDDQNSVRTYDLHPVKLTVDALLQQCDIRRTRHSGPGGQHRNKVETAIEITHRPTGIISFAAERRSQEQNRQVAISPFAKTGLTIYVNGADRFGKR